MSARRLVSRIHCARLLAAGLVAAAVGSSAPARAAQGGVLQITVAPPETKWLRFKELLILLDGVPIAAEMPQTISAPSMPIYSDVISPGSHQLDVRAGLVGDSNAFSYVKGYVFKMGGQAQFDLGAGELVSIQLQVVTRSGLTVEWTDKHSLAMRPSHFALDKKAAQEAQVPDAPAVAANEPDEDQPSKDQPTAEIVPTVALDQDVQVTCSLETPQFAVARWELDGRARVSLDRFAICVSKNTDLVTLEGYADPRGSAVFNQRLGEKRARQVAEYLARKGIPRARLVVKSYGKSRQLCQEAGEACWSRNRRVEAVTARSQ